MSRRIMMDTETKIINVNTVIINDECCLIFYTEAPINSS